MLAVGCELIKIATLSGLGEILPHGQGKSYAQGETVRMNDKNEAVKLAWGLRSTILCRDPCRIHKIVSLSYTDALHIKGIRTWITLHRCSLDQATPIRTIPSGIDFEDCSYYWSRPNVILIPPA